MTAFFGLIYMHLWRRVGDFMKVCRSGKYVNFIQMALIELC